MRVVFAEGMTRCKGKEFGEIFKREEQVERVPVVNAGRIRWLFEECSEGGEVSFVVVGEDAYLYGGEEDLFCFVILFTKGY